MSLFEIFVVAALATYRLTAMIHEETGPGHIFARFRNRIGVKFDQYSHPYGTNWVSEGVLCFYCLSVWIGIGIYLWLYFWTWIGQFQFGTAMLFPFAMSGVAVFMKKWTG